MNISLCLKCKNKLCLKTGKPCEKVEKYMRKQGIYDKDWIRPKMSSTKRKGKGSWREIPFTMLGWNTSGERQVKED